MHHLGYGDVTQAADRIRGHVRPVVVSKADPGTVPVAGGGEVWFALEYLQHTGSFKARGAVNFLRGHLEAGTLPGTGVTIASGGNAGLACAWAARALGVRATVFLPSNAPAVKVAKLRGYDADVRLVGAEYAEALAACEDFAAASGALASHAYDHPLIAAGAGTLLDEIRAQVPDLDTVVVAVGGGGLFAGVATAAQHHGLRTVAVEPENCRALNAAVEVGHPVDVAVDSIAADSLGARRATGLALYAARQPDTFSVLVADEAIAAARRTLWDHRGVATELGGSAALAALLPRYRSAGERGAADRATAALGTAARGTTARGYVPAPGEKVVVVLCGANTDPSDLTAGAPAAVPARD